VIFYLPTITNRSAILWIGALKNIECAIYDALQKYKTVSTTLMNTFQII